MKIISELKKLKVGKVTSKVELRKYTTYRLNEKALGLVYPDSVESLIKLLNYLKDNNIKHKIIGNGSNLIFTKYYEGILIKLTELKSINITDNIIKVESGYNLIKLSYDAANMGLSGLEFASGIPGTVGGAIYMNAGAYKSDMGYIVSEVKLLDPDLNIITMYNKELDFHYRTSFLMKNKDYICLEATLKLENKNKQEILDLMEDRKKRRLETQPLDKPCAGSVFRNPENDSAWRLIEQLGYKGKSINDAKVSEKHANFIINTGKARGKDIINLINEIKEKVNKEYGIDLKLEQEIVE
ncbi:MAG: UDP-N-acetylmuramate dehydrogenase [Bacilli bacterium]|nr:UDP-N-acetylmuramate dehydrogenase [Bacilli bacterium]